MTAHSPSCLWAGTPISSKVLGPLPGGGFALAAGLGVGVVGLEGGIGASVRVTGFRGGASVGGLELGREDGAEALPPGAVGAADDLPAESKAGIEGELAMAGEAAAPGGRGPYCRFRRSSRGAEKPISACAIGGLFWGGGTEAEGPGR